MAKALWQSLQTMTELARRNSETQEIMPSSLDTLTASRRPSLVKKLESLIQKVSKAIFPNKLPKDAAVNSNNTLHAQSFTREAEASVSNLVDLNIVMIEEYKRAEKFRNAFLKTERIYTTKIEVDFNHALHEIGLESLKPEFDILLKELKLMSETFVNLVREQQNKAAESKCSLIAESRLEWEPVNIANRDTIGLLIYLTNYYS